MIAVSVRERAATRSKGEEVAGLVPPSESPVVSAAAVSERCDATAERHIMIAEAAYYIAERRGFAPGYELEDWLCAEREISG